ncbi:MAG: hypothetical protein SF187_06725 [Deltaproteobacteria bacterium]|nr:hypothetical protein [Deltaproteobacteria bacterium]
MKFKARSSVWLALVAGILSCGGCMGNEGLDTDDGGGGSGQGGQGAKGGEGGGGGSSTCGPVCAIACEFGNVLDEAGCPTCACNPPPKQCGPKDCANQAAPAIAKLCPDGSAVGFSCRLNTTGKCSLQQDQCPTTCKPVTCKIACQFGFKKDAAGCDLCACADAPTCKNTECGPVPPVAPCPGGTGPAMSCVRSATTGKCAWNIGQCNVCTGPVCDIFCEFGNKVDANGCALCQCNPAPVACTTEECGVAPKVATRICEDGSTAGPVCSRTNGKCGWQITSCPAACSELRDLKTCELNTACQWLEPGCSGNKLPVAGCFAKAAVNCESDQECVPGKQCATRTVDHCANRPNVKCFTCASPINVCL